MKIVFFGSSKYSTIVQKSLFDNFGLSLVVTLPDKPVGRKKILTPTPVKKFAIDNNIPVIEAGKYKKIIKLYAKRYTLNANEKPDFLVVADYGLILPKELLNLPKYAPLNVHHSLLPKYRGPTPAPTAILNGDKVSGVSIIRMNEQLDAGNILAQKEYQLKPDETTDSLLTKLNELGAELVSSVIQTIKLNKPIQEKPQNESKATYTKRMSKSVGYINLSNIRLGEKLDRMIRAYYPWPTVWTRWNGKIVKFLPERKIQMEGKKSISYKDFLNGYPEAKEIISKLL